MGRPGSDKKTKESTRAAMIDFYREHLGDSLFFFSFKY